MHRRGRERNRGYEYCRWCQAGGRRSLAIENRHCGTTATPPVDLAPVSAVVIMVLLEVVLQGEGPGPGQRDVIGQRRQGRVAHEIEAERAPMPAEAPVAPSFVDGMAETVELLSSSAVA